MNDFADPRIPRLRYSLKALLISVAIIAAGSALVFTLVEFNRNADVRRIFGGSAGISILRNADRVEAYHIGKLADENNWSNAAVVDYPVITGPIIVSSLQAKLLATIFLDRTTYVWDMSKGCIPLPGVRVDFTRGNDRLQVLLCFECDLVSIFLNGKLVGGEDFDNARPALVQNIRAMFPNDPVIQSLVERH